MDHKHPTLFDSEEDSEQLGHQSDWRSYPVGDLTDLHADPLVHGFSQYPFSSILPTYNTATEPRGGIDATSTPTAALGMNHDVQDELTMKSGFSVQYALSPDPLNSFDEFPNSATDAESHDTSGQPCDAAGSMLNSKSNVPSVHYVRPHR